MINYISFIYVIDTMMVKWIFYLRWKREQLLLSLLVEPCGTLLLLFFLKMFRQTLPYFLHQHEYDEDSDCDDDDRQLCLCRLIKKKKVSIYYLHLLRSNDFFSHDFAIWQTLNSFWYYAKAGTYSCLAKFYKTCKSHFFVILSFYTN